MSPDPAGQDPPFYKKISSIMHSPFKLNVCHRGQVFTPEEIVLEMLSLRQNKGSVLEPSCGQGAFLKHLNPVVGIELDPNLIRDKKVWVGDFFAYPLEKQFDTIIGNPPYVRFQDIEPRTKKLLPMEGFDRRSNLYLFFISKSMAHLKNGGELIFITPRDFLKATSAQQLNSALYRQGSITYYRELGDRPAFKGYAPNCAIWRWQKACFNRQLLNQQTWFHYNAGQIWFGRHSQNHKQLRDLFEVKVGAVSGADSIFTNEKRGNANMVCSQTAVTGKTRQMIYNIKDKALYPHKKKLLNRRIRAFDESNWWEWGRKHCEKEGPRLYVNCKTRNPKPFFTHKSCFYDGSVLALFPKAPDTDVDKWADRLNKLKWAEMGFVCGGRLLFNQQSLSNAPLDLPL